MSANQREKRAVSAKQNGNSKEMTEHAQGAVRQKKELETYTW